MAPVNRNKTTEIHYCGRSLTVDLGAALLDALLEAGIDHRHMCGGLGFCTSCRVQVVSGGNNLSTATPAERERLGSDCGAQRLACQVTVLGPVSVDIPVARPARFSLRDAEE